jgi:hypothetical protein
LTALAKSPPLSAGEPPTLAVRSGVWAKWLTRALSLGLLVVVLGNLGRTDPAALRDALPDTPWFAVTFLALYFIVPLSDWAIFRILWRLPAAGLPILVGKRISNEMLFAYSGEAYFYLWARRRAGLTAAPFATIKDVNILSALTGNLLALALLYAVWLCIPSLGLDRYTAPLTASAGVMLAVPIGILVANRKLFSLTRRQVASVTAIHLARLLGGVVLSALLWSLCLPEAPLELWIALAVLRMVIGRIPFAPNAELTFAAVALLLVGKAADVASVIALTAAAVVFLHLILGGALLLWSALAGGRGAVWGSGDPGAHGRHATDIGAR